MLRLWGRDTSSNVMKAIWLLEELKIPYERLDVGGPFGGNQTPQYLTMNPTGLIPTLQDDEFVLWESNAILRYICHTNAPQSELFGPSAQARAVTDQWMDFQQTTLNRPQSVLFVNYVRTPPEQRDATALAKALTDAAKAWSVIEDALAGQNFICGNVLTLADIVFGVHVHRWFSLPIERPDLVNLRGWYERLLRRPIYAERIARPMV